MVGYLPDRELGQSVGMQCSRTSVGCIFGRLTAIALASCLWQLTKPINHHTWCRSKLLSSSQYTGRRSFQHLFNSCLKALTDGCYFWYYDQVLGVVVRVIGTAIESSKYHHRKKTIKFFKTREKTYLQPQTRVCLFSEEWIFGRQWKFPDLII